MKKLKASPTEILESTKTLRKLFDEFVLLTGAELQVYGNRKNLNPRQINAANLLQRIRLSIYTINILFIIRTLID